jgi:serine/threonine protein kinase
MFECLTGKLPFDAPNAMALALALAIIHGASPNVRSGRADVPEDLATIIGRCMQRERAQRFADATALYVALGRVSL